MNHQKELTPKITPTIHSIKIHAYKWEHSVCIALNLIIISGMNICEAQVFIVLTLE